jgi:hypothetical protein
MSVRTEWETWTVSSCPKLSLSALSPGQLWLLGHGGKAASLRKQHQVVLTSKTPDDTRSPVTESGPKQLFPFVHGHTGKRLPHIWQT